MVVSCFIRVLKLIDVVFCFFFFFKQKTAYEMRISDWSSDVCSSDLHIRGRNADRITVAAVSPQGAFQPLERGSAPGEWRLSDIADLGEKAEILLYITDDRKIGRASCRERVCQYV